MTPKTVKPRVNSLIYIPIFSRGNLFTNLSTSFSKEFFQRHISEHLITLVQKWMAKSFNSIWILFSGKNKWVLNRFWAIFHRYVQIKPSPAGFVAESFGGCSHRSSGDGDRPFRRTPRVFANGGFLRLKSVFEKSTNCLSKCQDSFTPSPTHS